jgi:hypothetical protein
LYHFIEGINRDTTLHFATLLLAGSAVLLFFVILLAVVIALVGAARTFLKSFRRDTGPEDGKSTQPPGDPPATPYGPESSPNPIWAALQELRVAEKVDRAGDAAKSLVLEWRDDFADYLVIIIPMVSLLAVLIVGIGYKFRLTVDAVARPWLPAETVMLANPSSRIVGYTLSSDGTWTVILKESDRRLQIVRTSEVTSRVPCRVGPDLGRPLIPLRKVSSKQPPEDAC